MRDLIFVFRFFAERLRGWMSGDFLGEIRGCTDKKVSAAHGWIEDVECQCGVGEGVILYSGNSRSSYIFLLIDIGKQWADRIFYDVFYDVVRRIVGACLSTFCLVTNQFQSFLGAMKMVLHQTFVDRAKLLDAQVTEIDRFHRQCGLTAFRNRIEH